MFVEIPSAVIGALFGAVLTGLGFALSTVKQLALVNSRLDMMESQLNVLGEYRPKGGRNG